MISRCTDYRLRQNLRYGIKKLGKGRFFDSGSIFELVFAGYSKFLVVSLSIASHSPWPDLSHTRCACPWWPQVAGPLTWCPSCSRIASSCWTARCHGIGWERSGQQEWWNMVKFLQVYPESDNYSRECTRYIFICVLWIYDIYIYTRIYDYKENMYIYIILMYVL